MLAPGANNRWSLRLRVLLFLRVARMRASTNLDRPSPLHGVRMQRRLLLAVSTLMLLTVSDLQAQKPVAVEGGLFGQFTKLDEELAMDDVGSIGGRLGVYVAFRNFMLELDGQYGKSTWAAPAGATSIDFMPVALRGVYGLPLGERLRLMLGAGIQENIYKGRVRTFPSGAVAGNEYEDAFTGLVGLKYCLNEKWSLRADGVVDHNPHPNFNGSLQTLNGASTSYGFRIGVSTFFKGYCYERPIAVPPPPPAAPPPAPVTQAPAPTHQLHHPIRRQPRPSPRRRPAHPSRGRRTSPVRARIPSKGTSRRLRAGPRVATATSVRARPSRARCRRVRTRSR